jgi:hypothetical protein
VGAPHDRPPSEPVIDEHRLAVPAPQAATWDALVRFLRADPTRARVIGARVLGADPTRSSGDELEVGSTIPGFRVARVRAGELLVLQGSHRFSTYTLVFRLSADGDRTTISAVSAARFPGAPGMLYRALVVGSGLHRVAVRAMLRRIAAGV